MGTRKFKAAIIGFGRMGELYLREIAKNNYWDILYILDIDPSARDFAEKTLNELSLTAQVLSDDTAIFSDPEVDAVILTALADSRMGQIEKAVAAGKNIITEKPLSDKIENEWQVVKLVANSGVLATVNLPLRNAWYNLMLRDALRSGELGDLAIIRICHMTPGLAPGEGHAPEGPCFHDCGLHYVDLARWMAESEFKTWHAQGLDFWDYGEPWWLNCHGTFENGVVFDITQGHIYGQLAKDLTHLSYNDIIGTKGVARMTHDFKTAVVEIHGVTKTIVEERPFGDKNIDILLNLFADSLEKKSLSPLLPTLREAAMASEYAWRFLEDADKNDLPVRGDKKTLKSIINRRSTLNKGYGLLRHNK